LDYYIFFCLINIFDNVQSSLLLVLFNVLARLVSAVTNYNLNKNCVFKKESDKNAALKYACLAISILGANSFFLYTLVNLLSIPAAFAKILTEIALFIISFTMQRKFIFAKKTKQESLEPLGFYEKGKIKNYVKSYK